MGGIDIPPGKTLPAAVAKGLIALFQGAAAAGTGQIGRKSIPGAKNIKGDYRHGLTKRNDLIFRLVDLKQLVWRGVETVANLLQNIDGGYGLFADDVCKMPGAAVAAFGGLFVTEALYFANLQKGVR